MPDIFLTQPPKNTPKLPITAFDNQQVTMTIKIKTYSTLKVCHIPLVIVLIILLSACSDEQSVPQTPELQVAEGLIWRNPDSCRQILASINYDSLPLSEQMYWYLLHEHANQKGYLPTSPDSIMPIIINYFTQTNNYRYLSEAYYVQGLQYMAVAQYNKAVLALKHAENYIDYLDSLEPYAGLIYYRLGNVCESEQLYSISLEYYQKAVPYLEKCASHYYLAFCYREISRTAHSKVPYDSTLVDNSCQKALSEAIVSGNSNLSYEIKYHDELNKPHRDTIKLFELAQYMSDSLQLNHYAYFVAMYCLQQGDTRRGTEYLHRFAEDTVYSDWAKIQYRYLQSLLYHKTGRTLQAYNMLQRVYHDLWTQLQEDADARVYAISRHYDLEREQNRSLQLQIEKQRLHITIAGVVVLLLICVLVAWLIIMHQRTEKRITQQQNEQERLKEQAERLLAEKKYIEAEKQRADAENQRIEA